MAFKSLFSFCSFSSLRFIVLSACVFILAACVPVSWQQPTWVSAIQRPGVDPFVQNQQLGRGINLGNALEAPQEGSWGVTLYEDYFTAIADAGFQHVRVPIRWNAHALADPPYTIDPDFFARIDWVVAQAEENHLLVILDFHHYEEMFTDPQANKARFLGLWKQIAEHYADAPDMVLFELLNEPHDGLTSFAWNEMIPDVLAAIRPSNPTRNLIVGPGNWYNVSQLYTLTLPKDDKHLIASVHYYEPFHFTHQGAEWAEGSSRWLGTTWEETNVQRWAVEADLGKAARWGKENGRPIYLGEFGAYSRADMPSRARYTAFVARTAESLGMSWAYWEFGAGFGVYERGTGTWKAELLGALIPEE
jgi:endoglucanase